MIKQFFFRFPGNGKFNFIRENGKIITQFVLTLFFIIVGIWFLKHEHAELQKVSVSITSASFPWVIAGVGLTIIYIMLQGLMYVSSFGAVRKKLGFFTAVILFLKRNFISVFLPVGGVASLAFFTDDIEKQGISKTQIHFASSIYAFVGIVSVIIVALPAFVFGMIRGSIGFGEWYALGGVVLLVALLCFIYFSLSGKGLVYRVFARFAPSVPVLIDDIRVNKVDKRKFLITVLYSCLIEVTGITHLYVAMHALHLSPSLFMVVLGYIVSVVFLIISPFLRGIGAIEVSMAFMLVKFGFSNVEAISATLLYRFFEFWLPLFAGILSFLVKINKLLMRVIPAILLFLLGIINIISVLTPAIASRLENLQHFLPLNIINGSNYFVLIAGFFLLITAAFMLKGLRSAWWFAVTLSIISVLGNLSKAVDYEEATVALFVLITLLATRKEYYVKNNPKLRYVGFQTALLSISAVLIYGILGFYFLDKKHFDIDFNWIQSIRYTFLNYFFIGSSDLIPADPFAKYFLLSINISGLFSIAFLLYTLIWPYVSVQKSLPGDNENAKALIEKIGCSPQDYFKTYRDKMIFLLPEKNAFIAYRISGNFAVVLEDPVAPDSKTQIECILLFDQFCYENGLKSIFYRVPEESLTLYKESGKKAMFMGQEAIVHLDTFTLEGKTNKTFRQAIHKFSELGYKVTIHTPPVKDGLLQKIKSVSDEWLSETGRKEIIFSQGMFIWEELKQQTILTVENPEEKIEAFLNLIPDYKKGEATYDLVRKTKDAPNRIMEFLMVELFHYLKTEGYKTVNLGFAPMSGIGDTHAFTQKSMRFAYEKIRSFSHFRGLRDFKDKFSPEWNNKYLIYSNDYDLLQLPVVLSKVIKP